MDENYTIRKQIEIKAPLEKVWNAIIDHEQFGKWFRVKIDKPFAVGEVSTGNITYPGYEHIKWKAKIKEIVEYKLFSLTWHPYACDPDVDYDSEEPTLVEFRLEKTDNGTLLTVIESGFDKIPKHRFAEAFRMNEGGWEQQMKNVSDYVLQTKQPNSR